MHSLRWAFIVLAFGVFTYQFGDGINRSLNNNFFVEVLGMRPDQMGLWTSLREMPGLLMVFVAALGMRLAPPWLGALSLFVNGLGYGGFALVHNFGQLVVTSVIGSSGFHLWMPVNSALGLSVAKRETAGKTLGQLQGAGFAGLLLSMGLMFLLVQTIGYRVAFLLSGVVLLLGALVMTRFPMEVASWPEQRIVVRRRYWLYYLLNFLEGTRFQVFLAFGVYLLVHEYRLNVQTVTLLFIISSIIGVVMAPRVGRWIDRFGERASLTASYSANFLVFLGFAFIHSWEVAVVLYVAYNFLMLFNIALNTYLKRIADPADLGPSLALGVTTMHIPSVVVPLIGGVLWERLGYQIPFLMGASFVLGSLIASQFLPARAKVGKVEAVQATEP